jgi:hypothetical protein
MHSEAAVASRPKKNTSCAREVLSIVVARRQGSWRLQRERETKFRGKRSDLVMLDRVHAAWRRAGLHGCIMLRLHIVPVWRMGLCSLGAARARQQARAVQQAVDQRALSCVKQPLARQQQQVFIRFVHTGPTNRSAPSPHNAHTHQPNTSINPQPPLVCDISLA